jgi:hypothetical protein
VFDLPVSFRRCDVPRFPPEPLFVPCGLFIKDAKNPVQRGRSHALLFISLLLIYDIHACCTAYPDYSDIPPMIFLITVQLGGWDAKKGNGLYHVWTTLS